MMHKSTTILAVLMTVIGVSLSVMIFVGPTQATVGDVELTIGQASTDQGELDSLTITFSMARTFLEGEEGWTETVLDDTPVDLEDLDGPGSATIANLTLEEGRYTKLELVVDEVEAEVDGKTVEIIVPSGKLMIPNGFTVGSDSTATFEFDIRLVKRGNQDVYNLVPVIGKKVGPDRGKSDDKGNGGDGGPGNMGALVMTIGSSKDSIDVFDKLNVTFDKARIYQAVNNSTESNWTEVALDNVTVDLTNLTATNETIVGNLSLDAGNYTKVELFVSKIVGIVDGVEVDVKVPSGKLKIVGDFEVKANETTSFVFDIHVVQKGNRSMYNLTPVIAKNQGEDED